MSSIAPNECPYCDAPAYVGTSFVECTNPACNFYHKETALKHYIEELDNLPTDRFTEPAPLKLELDWDEDTEPQLFGLGPAVPSTGLGFDPFSKSPDEIIEEFRREMDAVIADISDPQEVEAMELWRDRIIQAYKDHS